MLLTSAELHANPEFLDAKAHNSFEGDAKGVTGGVGPSPIIQNTP